MKWISHYCFYSLKVMIGAIILIIVALASTPRVFAQKLGLKDPADGLE